MPSVEKDGVAQFTWLRHLVEHYNASRNTIDYDTLKHCYACYASEPKTPDNLYSILPLAYLNTEEAEHNLVRPLLKQLRQDILASTLEVVPLMYAMAVILTRSPRQFGADYMAQSLEHLAPTLNNHHLSPAQTTLWIQFMNKSLQIRDAEQTLPREIINPILIATTRRLRSLTALSDSALSLAAHHEVLLLRHTRNTARLTLSQRRLLTCVGRTSGGVLLGGAQPTLQVIGIVALFTWAAASSVAPPLGIAIAMAVATGLVLLPALQHTVSTWWQTVREAWQERYPHGEQRSYQLCRDIIMLLPLVSAPPATQGPSSADVYQWFSEQLHHFPSLHRHIAPLLTAHTIHRLAHTSSTDVVNAHATAFINCCTDLYGHKYTHQRHSIWLVMLARLAARFPDIPVRQQMLARIESQGYRFKKSPYARYDAVLAIENAEAIDSATPTDSTMNTGYQANAEVIATTQQRWLTGRGIATRSLLTLDEAHSGNAFSWQHVKPYYIPPQLYDVNASTDFGDVATLQEQIKTAAMAATVSASSVCHKVLLVGEAGMGKSSALQYLHEKLSIAHQHAPFECPLPIFIALSSPAITGLAPQGEGIAAHLRALDLTLNTTTLQAMYPVIFLLDGYDELVFSRGNAVAKSIVEHLALSQWRCSVVLSCRQTLAEEAMTWGITHR